MTHNIISGKGWIDKRFAIFVDDCFDFLFHMAVGSWNFFAGKLVVKKREIGKISEIIVERKAKNVQTGS